MKNLSAYRLIFSIFSVTLPYTNPFWSSSNLESEANLWKILEFEKSHRNIKLPFLKLFAKLSLVKQQYIKF